MKHREFLKETFRVTWIYSRHPLYRTPKAAAKKFEIAKDQKKNCILHTRKYINQTCNTLRGKIETKGTLLGEKSKIA